MCRVAEATARETDLVADVGEFVGASTLVRLAAAELLAQPPEIVRELAPRLDRGVPGHVVLVDVARDAHARVSRFFQPAHLEPASRPGLVNLAPIRLVSVS